MGKYAIHIVAIRSDNVIIINVLACEKNGKGDLNGRDSAI